MADAKADPKKTIFIGCKLPSGIMLEVPNKPSKDGCLSPTPKEHKVLIKGLNKIRLVGAPYALTEVELDFWNVWKTANKNSVLLSGGAIFEANSIADADAIAEERKEQKTGFEQMRKDGTDPRAMGVKAIKDDDQEAA